MYVTYLDLANKPDKVGNDDIKVIVEADQYQTTAEIALAFDVNVKTILFAAR